MDSILNEYLKNDNHLKLQGRMGVEGAGSIGHWYITGFATKHIKPGTTLFSRMTLCK